MEGWILRDDHQCCFISGHFKPNQLAETEMAIFGKDFQAEFLA
jgi:hypothetical protein